MHCLVVCGTAEPDSDADAALFGDFLGFSMVASISMASFRNFYLLFPTR